CHLQRITSRFVPFSEGSITADENLQTGPPVRPHVQGPCRCLKSCFFPPGKKPSERQNVTPHEILRVVWAQTQTKFEWRGRFYCPSAKKKRHSQDKMAQCKTGTNLSGFASSPDRIIKAIEIHRDDRERIVCIGISFIKLDCFECSF